MFANLFRHKQEKTPKVIVVIAIILGVVWQYFFFEKAPGLAFPLFTMLLLLGLFAAIIAHPERKNFLKLWLVAPVIFFSWMVFVRADGGLSFGNYAISRYLLLLLTYLVANMMLPEQLRIKDLLKTVVLPFIYLVQLPQLFKKMPRKERVLSKSKEKMMAIGRGLLITLPILIVFFALFVAADAGFAKLMSDILSFEIEIDSEIFLRTLAAIINAVIIAGALTYTLYNEKKAERQADEVFNEKDRGVEVSVLLISLNILFCIFAAVQFSYLFGGNTMVANLGIAYAEYARQGFAQLVFIAMLTLGIVWVCDYGLRKSKDAHNAGFQVTSTLLIIQTLIISASAFYRLSLYEEAFGFTASRLQAHIIIIWIALMLVLLAYKILAHASQQLFFRGMVISALAIVAFLDVANPEAFIARKNIDRFHETGKLDAKYLGQLSNDAVPTIVNALDTDLAPLRGQPNAELNELVAQMQGRRDNYDLRDTAWQSIKIADIQAKSALEKGTFYVK